MAYFKEIFHTIGTLWEGIKVTFPHLRKGYESRQNHDIEKANYFEEANKAVTIQYPFQNIPIPDNGRYLLHLEAEDCIVCDKCARICPVDCIDIEGFKATEDLGTTSDGSKKRLHLPVFDIDMAKCCYCGLCTTVCPTECLTMTKVYDVSVADRNDLVYHFGLMTKAEAAAKKAEQAK